MKKGQGLSITTIVVAAIALLVLVVLVAVFTGRIGGFSKAVASCEQKGGTCTNVDLDDYSKVPLGAKCVKDSETRYFGKTNCDANNQICCIPLY